MQVPAIVQLGERLKHLFLIAAVLAFTGALYAQLDDATKQLSRDIFKQLIEINTTESVGSVTRAAEAMAQRFRESWISGT